MSNDTPRPERVTLSDEERESLICDCAASPPSACVVHVSIEEDLTRIRRSTNRIEGAYGLLSAEYEATRLELSNVSAERDAALRDYGRASTRVAELEAEVQRLTDLLAQQGDDRALIYETDFVTNDGWSMSTIAKNHDQAWALPRNVNFTSAFGLIVDVKRETHTRNGITREFTSGEARGRHVTVPNYFEAEIAATCTVVRGVRHCPLWFRPLNHSDGEIDIIETMGSERYGITTVHSEYDNRKMIQDTTQWPNGKPDARYVYRIRKEPGRIRVWIDDLLMFDYGPASPGGVPNDFPWDRIFENPDRTWYPRISSEVGCPPDRPNCTVGTPASDLQYAPMLVEYLKIWELA